MSNTLENYFANLKNPKQADDIQLLRQFLKEQLPEATEDMTYPVPTYSQNGQVVVSLASQAHYMSLYMDVDLIAKYRDEFGKLNCGKSCIRFKKLDDLPLETVATIIRETLEKQSS
jgi:uncharacterized protein YdhG (YjbR/CyaY superfamily)